MVTKEQRIAVLEKRIVALAGLLRDMNRPDRPEPEEGNVDDVRDKLFAAVDALRRQRKEKT